MRFCIDTKRSKELEFKANRLLNGKKTKVKIKKKKLFFVKDIKEMNEDFYNKLREK